MKDIYICKSCKAVYRMRALESSGLTNCKHCGTVIPRSIVKQWRAQRPKRSFHLECMCGRTYKITPPEGDFRFVCKKCGRLLLSISPRTMNGIHLPRYIEEVQSSKQ